MYARNLAVGGSIRAAIVGAGYIADFHARAIKAAHGVQLAAVCDVNATVVEASRESWGVPAYTSLETMLAEQRLDVVHVLVPPDLHHKVAKTALEAGVSVLLEKPMCASAADTRYLLAIAKARGLTVGVNHSMLFEGAFQRLRDHVRGGDLGPLDHVTINYFAELPFIRFGPFGNWMLREPGNALLEIGPHPYSSGLVDLIGVPEQDPRHRGSRYHPAGRSSRLPPLADPSPSPVGIAADVNIELGPGFPQRMIVAHGLLGCRRRLTSERIPAPLIGELRPTLTSSVTPAPSLRPRKCAVRQGPRWPTTFCPRPSFANAAIHISCRSRTAWRASMRACFHRTGWTIASVEISVLR